MKQASKEVARRLYLMSGLMFAGHGIGMWCYSRKKKLYYSTSPYRDELRMFLELSGILSEIATEDPNEPRPMVYSDELGLIWIGERVNVPDEAGEVGDVWYVFCGPAFLRKNTRNEVLAKLTEMNLSVALRLKYSEILSNISVLETDALRTVYRQLHFDIYDEYLPEGAFQITSVPDTPASEKTGNAENEAAEAGRPAGKSGVAREQGAEQQSDPSEIATYRKTVPDAVEYGKMKKNETDLLNCVRTGIYEDSGKIMSSASGNPNQNGEHSYGGFVDYDLSDELRSLKDNMILFIGNCSDAAIEGGLPLETSKAIQRESVYRLEKCRTVGDAANTNWQAFLSYVDAVHKTKERAHGGISLPVQSTMDYIRRNYNTPLSIADLASQAGYSEYYLSRKFTKETGMKIQDYIRNVRMDMAKVMLVSTQLSIYEIAEQLQYKSRSHFDRTFTAIVGVSPSQYRAGREI